MGRTGSSFKLASTMGFDGSIKTHRALAKGPPRGAAPSLGVRNVLLGGLLRRVAEDGLGLQEFVEGVVAPLAPVAAHLVAAEGGGHVAAAAVDRHLAGAQPRGHLAGLVDVGG